MHAGQHLAAGVCTEAAILHTVGQRLSLHAFSSTFPNHSLCEPRGSHCYSPLPCLLTNCHQLLAANLLTVSRKENLDWVFKMPPVSTMASLYTDATDPLHRRPHCRRHWERTRCEEHSTAGAFFPTSLNQGSIPRDHRGASSPSILTLQPQQGGAAACKRGTDCGEEAATRRLPRTLASEHREHTQSSEPTENSEQEAYPGATDACPLQEPGNEPRQAAPVTGSTQPHSLAEASGFLGFPYQQTPMGRGSPSRLFMDFSS